MHQHRCFPQKAIHANSRALDGRHMLQFCVRMASRTSSILSFSVVEFQLGSSLAPSNRRRSIAAASVARKAQHHFWPAGADRKRRCQSKRAKRVTRIGPSCEVRRTLQFRHQTGESSIVY